jgi:hypothetical protein
MQELNGSYITRCRGDRMVDGVLKPGYYLMLGKEFYRPHGAIRWFDEIAEADNLVKQLRQKFHLQKGKGKKFGDAKSTRRSRLAQRNLRNNKSDWA